MKYCLTISDYDNTFARTDGSITPYTKTALQKYISLGGKFVIASGRAHEGINCEIKRLGIDYSDNPIISFNGALIKYSRSNKVIYDNRIPIDSAEELCIYIDKIGVYYHFFIDGKIICNSSNDFNQSLGEALGITLEYTELPLAKYCKNLRGKAAGINKLIIHEPDYFKMQEITKKIRADLGNNYSIVTGNRRVLEFSAQGTSKGVAANFLADYLKIPMQNVLAMGDNNNDVDLLRRAGLGIAVANAVEEAKAAAVSVSPYSNNEDSVARTVAEINDIEI